MEYKITFDDRTKYLSKKYLLQFSDTVSLTRMERNIQNGKADPRMINVAAVYAYINGIKTNKYKHSKIFEDVEKIEEQVSNLLESKNKSKLTIKDIESFKVFIKEAKENNFNKEYLKIFKNLFVIQNKNNATKEVKEAFRKKLEKFIEEEKISYNDFSKNVANSVIDQGNLYKFVKNKEYDKVSTKKIMQIRNEMEKIV